MTRSQNNVFNRNNLDKAVSPYLRQHKDNPVFWQEWSKAALDHAKKEDRIVFVSVGYSTCHWCHVMAREAFSDQDCANYLNSRFLSIKIDREERPDIDKFMMSFLTALTGSGGWPLNVFLTPDLKPFFAMTYGPLHPKFGMPGFLDTLMQIKDFYNENKEDIREFTPDYRQPASAISGPEQADAILREQFDPEYGGLQGENKFPPHSALLYSLYRIADRETVSGLEQHVARTLDAIRTGGLHDHLQGGFFRYCVDRQWSIPHFEKMLYDQAMLLWVFSLASRVFANHLYKADAEGIFRCLTESFLDDNLFCAAHDADTNHSEGETYLWTAAELRKILAPAEFSSFSNLFYLPPEGNFHGKIHLRRKQNSDGCEECREKLLAIRRARPQPFLDRKKITSWNALAGMALIQMYRHTDNKNALDTAMALRETLLKKHLKKDGSVIHGSLDNSIMSGRFLEDHASLLLFLTYAHEEDNAHGDIMNELSAGLDYFKQAGHWTSANEPDFNTVPAERHDAPVPSETSTALLAAARAAMLSGHEYRNIPFGTPGSRDFQNMAALETGGYAFLVSAPEPPLPWDSLPPHTVQIKGAAVEHCRKGKCTAGPPAPEEAQ